MSELKAVHAFDVYEAYTKTGDDESAQVYPKSEADKVIAELKAREDVLVTDNRDLLEKVKMLEERLRENAEHFKRNEAQILENADKVIAKLEEKLDTTKKLLNKALDCISNGKNHMMSLARKNNHANYKRCLAMARICYMKSWSCLQYFTPREKYDHWKKWQKRWTELANKFKEAK